jgi:hypothetical protein
MEDVVRDVLTRVSVYTSTRLLNERSIKQAVTQSAVALPTASVEISPQKAAE